MYTLLAVCSQSGDGPLALHAVLLVANRASACQGLVHCTMWTEGTLALLALSAILGAVWMVVGCGWEGGSARASSLMALRVSVGLLF